ncbi:MAG: hypothetical protein HUU49_01445 [Candidatus Buchananbacteria bacterium]|nr:hypothetical protein [Candidatus Buchananbacteria bacterium]
MEDKYFNLFNDNNTPITHCPVCQMRYDPLEARILDEAENSHLVHVKCHHCQSAVLAVLLTNQLGISSIGLVTDLSSDDVMKFKSVLPVSVDDVIEAHEFLHSQKVLIDKI